MRYSPSVFLLVFAVSASPSASQSNAGRGGAYLQAGGTWSGIVDRNASALRYRGAGAGVVGGWRAVSERSRIEFGLSGSASRLSSRITTTSLNRESVLNLEIRFAVLRRVATLSSRDVSFLAGGQVLLNGLGRQHDFPYGATEKFADVFGTLGPAGIWEYRTRAGTVMSGGVTLPLLAVVGRTPYYGLKDPPEFTLRGPFAFTTVTHATRLEKPVAERAALLLDYRITLQRDEHPRRLRRVEHWVATGFELRRRAK